MQIFNWLDTHADSRKGRLANQLLPIGVCLTLFVIFMSLSTLFINYLINPYSTDKIIIQVYPQALIAGFTLYFLTAIDYALIVGRMQSINTGAKARFTMNVFTCIGCFIGVSLTLFFWGFAKEIPWLIIPLLIFAASVMLKLAIEGKGYFVESSQIPKLLKIPTDFILKVLSFPTTILSGWMPTINNPHLAKLNLRNLAKWSLLLPFIIGIDDLVGYMGAMTIYNVFSLLIGIYLADIAIDILIFVSPKLTTKIVQNPWLSIGGAYAFLYLAYRSLSEAYNMLRLDFSTWGNDIILAVVGFTALIVILHLSSRKSAESK